MSEMKIWLILMNEVLFISGVKLRQEIFWSERLRQRERLSLLQKKDFCGLSLESKHEKYAIPVCVCHTVKEERLLAFKFLIEKKAMNSSQDLCRKLLWK